MTGYLTFPPAILDSLCGGGDAAERDLLRATHVSKRMVQLRAVLDTVDASTARRAGLHANFQALAGVQRHDPASVAELLSGPQAGAWAALCLRLLTRDVPEPDDARTPLWVHLAHLGGIAASAALRRGLRIRVLAPVRAGAVHLPAVGRALVAGHDDWTLVTCETGPAGVSLNGAAPTAWQPVRLLRTEAGRVTLRVQLDDLDPYWRSFGIPTTGRLSESDVASWQRQLDGAWHVLADRHPHRLTTMAAAVRCLVPVQQAERVGSVSASSADAPGAVALTEPADPVRFAATLVHESQHYRLATLHDLRPLFVEPARTLRYSPWRNDPRPLAGVVHGLMAFAGAADFWARERTDLPSELEYARHVRQLRVAHGVAAGAPDLTQLGAALVDALGASVAALPLTTGPEAVRRIADDLVAEHRAHWRLRNVVPDEPAVRAAAAVWAGGELPDHEGQARAGTPSGDQPLTRVAMAWLENEAEVRALAGDGELFAKRFPGAAPTDVRLMTGDYATARADALARIADGSASDRTWSKLVVAHGRACVDPSRSPLVRAPELVRAAFAGMDPLLALLSRYEAGTSMSDSIRR